MVEWTVSSVQEAMHAVASEVEKVVWGQSRVVRLVTMAAFIRGHVLLYGLPGQGKTLLASALSRAIGGESERFQGSPDFLFNEALITAYPTEQGHLAYAPGRLLRHGERLGVVLIDEINRFLPNTQAGFLEVMQERKVTTPYRTWRLPYFIGIATQNPLETAETYPLPEALRDRFLMTVIMDYPDEVREREILARPSFRQMDATLLQVSPVLAVSELEKTAQVLAEQVHVSEAIREYVHRLVLATRNPGAYGVPCEKTVVAGVSTRGALQLLAASQAQAAWEGRDYVKAGDVREVAVEVLAHRVFLKGTSNPTVLARQARELVHSILERVPAL